MFVFWRRCASPSCTAFGDTGCLEIQETFSAALQEFEQMFTRTNGGMMVEFFQSFTLVAWKFVPQLQRTSDHAEALRTQESLFKQICANQIGDCTYCNQLNLVDFGILVRYFEHTTNPTGRHDFLGLRIAVTAGVIHRNKNGCRKIVGC